MRRQLRWKKEVRNLCFADTARLPVGFSALSQFADAPGEQKEIEAKERKLHSDIGVYEVRGLKTRDCEGLNGGAWRVSQKNAVDQWAGSNN